MKSYASEYEGWPDGGFEGSDENFRDMKWATELTFYTDYGHKAVSIRDFISGRPRIRFPTDYPGRARYKLRRRSTAGTLELSVSLHAERVRLRDSDGLTICEEAFCESQNPAVQIYVGNQTGYRKKCGGPGGRYRTYDRIPVLFKAVQRGIFGRNHARRFDGGTYFGS
jgi:hypothetical protein